MATAAKAAKYAGKLAFHGAKLGGRVLGILGGVAASALWGAAKSTVSEDEESYEPQTETGILYDSESQAVATSLDEAVALGQPLYYNRYGDQEEQGIWAKK